MAEPDEIEQSVVEKVMLGIGRWMAPILVLVVVAATIAAVVWVDKDAVREISGALVSGGVIGLAILLWETHLEERREGRAELRDETQALRIESHARSREVRHQLADAVLLDLGVLIENLEDVNAAVGLARGKHADAKSRAGTRGTGEVIPSGEMAHTGQAIADRLNERQEALRRVEALITRRLPALAMRAETADLAEPLGSLQGDVAGFAGEMGAMDLGAVRNSYLALMVATEDLLQG